MTGILNPQAVVQSLPIIEGMSIADFGAGSGFFSLALAHSLNNNGRVIALDASEKALDALNARAKLEKVSTIIETITANLEKPRGSKLNNGSVDMVLASNILFETKNKEAILKEAKRILKDTGYLVIIDWKPDKLPQSDLLYPLSSEEAKDLAKSLGFTFKEEIFVSDTHYCLVFTK